MHRPFAEHPFAQSASAVQLIQGLSEVAEQVPRFGPLGLLGQLSSTSVIPSPSLSIITMVVVLDEVLDVVLEDVVVFAWQVYMRTSSIHHPKGEPYKLPVSVTFSTIETLK